MKISKSMRHQVLEQFRHTDGTVDITDFLSDVATDDVLDATCEWLDENCANGHFSRWTSFGNNLYREACEYLQCLLDLRNSSCS